MSKSIVSKFYEHIEDISKPKSLFLAMILSLSAFAQVNGSINGTVTDASQASIPGANLTLRNIQTGENRQTASSAEGFFTFADVPRGEYSIRVSSQGFRELQLGPLVLTVGQQLTIRPVLAVGNVTETVEVQGTPPPVVTSTSSVSQLVDSKRIEQLPLNGRNALQLVALLPGVVNAGNGGQFGATPSHFQYLRWPQYRYELHARWRLQA